MTEPLRGGDISGHSLADVDRLYHRWFGADYDCAALTCVLCAAAAERLGGDPTWLLLVGGSGAAKTETIVPLVGAGAVAVSTINGEAALLSGTSKKDRSKDATGGLLRKIGTSGVLVIKDVTSILSMNRDTRALVLAALREVYDGSWSRNVGTDGGQTLTWTGRIAVIGAVTTAWDSAHSVISAMGDRFVLVRLDSSEHRTAAGLQAMGNVNQETSMRKQLITAVGSLLNTVDRAAEIELTKDELEQLIGVADLVTRTRTAVERDYQGNPQSAHALEMPTRFAKQLVQLVRGGIALGLPRTAAMAAALRGAGDSMPPLRMSVLGDVATNPPHSTVAEVVTRLQLPRKTLERVLQELQLLGVLVVGEVSVGQSTRWAYTLADAIDLPTVQKLIDRKSGQKCHHPSGEAASAPSADRCRLAGKAAS